MQKHTLIILKDELNVLAPLAKKQTIISRLLKLGKNEGHKMVVTINKSQREEVRTDLTILLAKIGFDEHYCPTKEGRLLEDLIDRLFEE